MATFTILKSDNDWNEFKQRAAETESEIVLAKVSPVCPISFSAESIIDRWANDLADDSVLLSKLDVIESRTLSRHLADVLGVVHQSPQVIWLDKNLNVKWHESHHQITVEALNQNLSAQ